MDWTRNNRSCNSQDEDAKDENLLKGSIHEKKPLEKDTIQHCRRVLGRKVYVDKIHVTPAHIPQHLWIRPPPMYFYFKSKYNKEDKNIFNQKHYEIYSKRLRDLLSYKKKRLTRKEAYLAALVSMEHIKSQGKNFKGEPMWNTHDLFLRMSII